MTVLVSARWMDCADCICRNRAFNIIVYLYWGQLLDTSTHLLSALSNLKWSCSLCFSYLFTHSASCYSKGCDNLNTNIYPDSNGLTCVSSVSTRDVAHAYAHAYMWIWIDSTYVKPVLYIPMKAHAKQPKTCLNHKMKAKVKRKYRNMLQLQKR